MRLQKIQSRLTVCRNFLVCRLHKLIAKSAKIDKKRNIKEAFSQLKSKVAKKKAKMADAEAKKADAKNAKDYTIKKIDDIKKQIESENFSKLDFFELKQKSLRVQKLWDDFDIKAFNLTTVDAEAQTSEADAKIEQICSSLKARIDRRIHEIQTTQIETTPKANETPAPEKSSQQPLKVTQNTWGEFSGELDEWHRFSKRFKKDVHDVTTLDEKEKLFMLRQACVSKAGRIVGNAIDNYELAWKKLNDVYGEAYTQIHFVMHKINGTSTMQHANADSIRSILQSGNQFVSILEEAIERHKFEAVLTPMMANKLDKETNRAWERQRIVLAQTWAKEHSKEASKYVPPWDELRKFLEDEIDVHLKFEMRADFQSDQMPDQSIAKAGKSAVEKNATSTTAQNYGATSKQTQPHEQKRIEFKPCTLCNQMHPLHRCEIYRAMSLSDKWTQVDKDGLCRKCLFKYHQGPCLNPKCNEKCPQCIKHGKTVYHNSSLCPEAYSAPSSTPKPNNDDEWE